MFTANIDYLKRKPVNIPKTTIWVDHGYHIDFIVRALQTVYPGILRKVRFQRSPKPSKDEKAGSRKIWVCRCESPLGGGALQCLDGTLQRVGEKF
jgi:hypothetical protein